MLTAEALAHPTHIAQYLKQRLIGSLPFLQLDNYKIARGDAITEQIVCVVNAQATSFTARSDYSRSEELARTRNWRKRCCSDTKLLFDVCRHCKANNPGFRRR